MELVCAYGTSHLVALTLSPLVSVRGCTCMLAIPTSGLVDGTCDVSAPTIRRRLFCMDVIHRHRLDLSALVRIYPRRTCTYRSCRLFYGW